jgi:hypothetical protein
LAHHRVPFPQKQAGKGRGQQKKFIIEIVDKQQYHKND